MFVTMKGIILEEIETVKVPANMRELANELGVSYSRLLRTAREFPEQVPMVKRVGRWYVLLPNVYIKWSQGKIIN